MKKTNRKSQAGFSLIELMIAILVMTIIMGAVFQQIDNMQKRQAHETAKLDIFQNAREFVDQMVRDIHQSGFPNTRMYSPASLATVVGGPSYQSQYIAVGLVYISPYEVKFEGDVDGDGAVDSVDYCLTGAGNCVAGANKNCPCLQRSQVKKVDGDPTAQGILFTTELENVVGTDPVTAAPVAVFEAYDQNGNQIALPAAGITRTDWTANPVTTDPVREVWTIRIRLDVKSKVTDIGTTSKPEVFLTASAQPLN